jgi:hypothetical protein
LSEACDALLYPGLGEFKRYLDPGEGGEAFGVLLKRKKKFLTKQHRRYGGNYGDGC